MFSSNYYLFRDVIKFQSQLTENMLSLRSVTITAAQLQFHIDPQFICFIKFELFVSNI